jgi:hypothetical protein
MKTRYKRFMCWVKTGHIWDKTNSTSLAGHDMNTCIYCGTIKAGL